MNFWKARKLESKDDVVPRGVFRFTWYTFPGLIIAFGSALLGCHRLLSVWFLAFIIAIPVLGVLVDGLRLKFKGSSNQ